MKTEPVKCYRCNGKGVIECPRCHGSGEHRLCNGRGYIVYQGESIHCTDCHGSGNCDQCNGAREVTCMNCEGTGVRFFD